MLASTASPNCPDCWIIADWDVSEQEWDSFSALESRASDWPPSAQGLSWWNHVIKSFFSTFCRVSEFLSFKFNTEKELITAFYANSKKVVGLIPVMDLSVTPELRKRMDGFAANAVFCFACMFANFHTLIIFIWSPNLLAQFGTFSFTVLSNLSLLILFSRAFDLHIFLNFLSASSNKLHWLHCENWARWHHPIRI